ncbi:uncharacterized protein N7459_002844 [Penicillium hispanicum]|uniref:uncharacterized protein n=1 Tax=Penicillium hispanicum TaxID=1080232 RepID=UPI0025417B2F|nr:uncharacterized protein N7459_002844 [Penicillium hispanicum]KAJ5587079.1 hypothetical protein N7459_002844 [Penicillium hispanicum]
MLMTRPFQIDHESVGRSLGISKMASQLRFLRLKKQMEKIEFLDEDDEQPAGKEGDEEEGLCNGKGKSKLKVVPEEDQDQVMGDEA